MTRDRSILDKNSFRGVSLLLLFMGTVQVANENSVYGRWDILIWIAKQIVFDSFVSIKNNYNLLLQVKYWINFKLFCNAFYERKEILNKRIFFS